MPNVDTAPLVFFVVVILLRKDCGQRSHCIVGLFTNSAMMHYFFYADTTDKKIIFF